MRACEQTKGLGKFVRFSVTNPSTMQGGKRILSRRVWFNCI